jgi:hypothetical protein
VASLFINFVFENVGQILSSRNILLLNFQLLETRYENIYDCNDKCHKLWPITPPAILMKIAFRCFSGDLDSKLASHSLIRHISRKIINTR